MVSLLNSLLASAQPAIDSQVGGAPITVKGMPLDALVNKQDIQNAQQNNDKAIMRTQIAADAAPQHTGMFGIKGTLRDVLGLVGDALLTGSGHKAVYAPGRQQERLSDALAGFTTNPEEAAERATSVDPAVGLELNQQIQKNALLKAQQEGLQAYRDQQIANAKATIQQKAGERFNSIMGSIKNMDDFQRALPTLKALKQRAELADDYVVPEQFDANAFAQYRRQGMTPYQQGQAEDADQRLSDARRYNDERISASRANTAVSASRAAEAARHNRLMESESNRHNKASEDNVSQKNSVYEAGVNSSIDQRNKKSGLESPKASGGGGKYVIRGGKLVKQ